MRGKGFVTPLINIGAAIVLSIFCFSVAGDYDQSIIALVGINIILAISLNLVNGYTGQFSMGHAGFMAVGAYAAGYLSTVLLPQFALYNEWKNVPGVSDILFFSITVFGGVISGIIGIFVGIPSLRLRGDYLAIVTLGFGEIIRILILNIPQVGGALGMSQIPKPDNIILWENAPILGTIAIPTMLAWIFVWGCITCLFCYRMLRSTAGKQFMAVRDDETAALSMGLSTTRIKVRAFAISSFFAGIAGALFAHQMQYITPSSFTFNLSFQIIAIIVLGGLGSLSGSILAAALLTVGLEALRILQTYLGVDIRMIVYALILIIIMLTRPEGIFGQSEIWDAWKAWTRKRKAA